MTGPMELSEDAVESLEAGSEAAIFDRFRDFTKKIVTLRIAFSRSVVGSVGGRVKAADGLRWVRSGRHGVVA